jgi:hypothetical protein
LAELEMQTRMALVPDDWDDPRDSVIHALAPDDQRETVEVR